MWIYMIQLEYILKYGQHDNLHEYSDIIKIIKKKEQHLVEIIHMVNYLHSLMFHFWFQRRGKMREKTCLKIKTENGSQLIKLCELEIQDAKTN